MVKENFQKLGPKTFWIFLIRRSLAVIFLLLIFLATFAARQFFTMPEEYDAMLNMFFSACFLALALAFAIAFTVAWLEYIRFRIYLSPDSFKIQRGVINRQEVAIPYRQIESVDLRQSLLYQVLGVSRMTIETVIDSGNLGNQKKDSDDEVLPAIDKNLAIILQDEIAKRANIQKMHLRENGFK